ncbi:hypothetical protein CLOP_g12767 [Closterium sp. NIES-67]|nr:hypothetical protein CLOP_g12767 [Closterium sp. NIES-67]
MAAMMQRSLSAATSEDDEFDEELDGFDDFTLASPWERFIAAVEGSLRQWLSEGSAALVQTGAARPVEGMPLMVYVEAEHAQGHKNYRLTYYFQVSLANSNSVHPSVAAETAAALKRIASISATGRPSPWEKAVHPLQLWFGIQEFVVLAPVTASGVVLDSPEASMLLSTLAIASCNTECSLPSFVPVHDPSRKAFIGFQHGPRATRTSSNAGSGRGVRSGPGAGGGTVGGVGAGGVGDYLFHYEADRITSNVPQNLLSLDGLYYLFAFKLIAELPSSVASVSPDVTVAMRIRYRLRYWGAPDAPPPSSRAGAGGKDEEGAGGGGAGSGGGADEEDEYWGQERAWDEGMAWSVWHAVDDPVKGFELVATWKELRASSSSGMAQMEQLDATTADEWLLRALLAPTRTDFDSDDPPQGFAGRLHALLGAYVVSTTGQYMEDFIAAQNFARRNNMTIPPPSVMERVVKDLFHSKEALASVAKYMGKVPEQQEVSLASDTDPAPTITTASSIISSISGTDTSATGSGVKGPGAEGAAAGAGGEGGGAGGGGAGVEDNGLSGKFKGATHIGKAAPVDSLFSRLALHVLRFGTCNIRSVAALWLEFTRELRWSWEQALPIPRVIADGPPHTATCLIHQKLQLLQECIRRRRKQQEREMEERMRHAERMHQIAAAKLVGERVEELVRGTALDDGLARGDSPSGRGSGRRGGGREREMRRGRGGMGSDRERRRGGREEDDWDGVERSGSEADGWHDGEGGRQGRRVGGRGWDDGDGASPYRDDYTASGDSDTHGSHDVAFYDEGGVVDSPSRRSEEDLDEYFSESDVSDDDTWAERGRTSHGSSGPMARGRRRVRRRGVVGPVKGDMWLLRVRRHMLEPHTQDPVFMSEDMIEEKERAMEALGSTPAGRETRARMQSDVVASDMAAFKAANPGAVLEDFVRWHSPNDWLEIAATDDDYDDVDDYDDADDRGRRFRRDDSETYGRDDDDDGRYRRGGRGGDDSGRYGRGDRYGREEDGRYGREDEDRYGSGRDDRYGDESGRYGENDYSDREERERETEESDGDRDVGRKDGGRDMGRDRGREREREGEEGREYGDGDKSKREDETDFDKDGPGEADQKKQEDKEKREADGDGETEGEKGEMASKNQKQEGGSPSPHRSSSSPGKGKDEEEEEFFEAAQEEKPGEAGAGEGGEKEGGGVDEGADREEKLKEGGEDVGGGGEEEVEEQAVSESEGGGLKGKPRVEDESEKAVEKEDREGRENSDREREGGDSDRERDRGREREEGRERARAGSRDRGRDGDRVRERERESSRGRSPDPDSDRERERARERGRERGREEREYSDDREEWDELAEQRRGRDRRGDRDREDDDDYEEDEWRGGRGGGTGGGRETGGRGRGGGSGRGAGGGGGGRRRRVRDDGSGWPPRGRLSERMEEMHGNLWRELWDSAEPEPAHEQRPIFHFDLEGEKILHYLDTVVPEELLGQLLATAFSSAVLLLGRAEAAREEPVAEQRQRVAGMVASMWQWLDDQSAGSCSDERVEDLEVLLRAFTRMEATVMVAASLWKRLQGCSRLVVKLLTERALNATDVPSVRLLPAPIRLPHLPEPDSRTDEWRVVGKLWQEKEPSGSSSNDSSGASSTTPGSSSGSGSSGAPPLPPAASKSAAGGGGRRMGNLLYRHEPTEREVIFTSPAFVIFNTVDEEDAATGTVASRDSVEIVKHQLYAKASLDDLTLALKVAAQE